jgi:hypothetical protein
MTMNRKFNSEVSSKRKKRRSRLNGLNLRFYDVDFVVPCALKEKQTAGALPRGYEWR